MKSIGILDKLFSKYADESIEVQKKIKIVFWVNLIFATTTSIFIILYFMGIKLLAEGSSTIIITIIIVIISIISLIFLHQKQYYISSLLTVCGFQIATLFANLLSIRTGKIADNFMVVCLIQLFTLIIANIVPTSIITLIIVGFGPVLYFSIFSGAVFAVNAYKLSGGDEAFTPGFFIVIVSSIIYFLSGLNNRGILATVNKQATDLQEIIDRLKNSINELVAISKRCMPRSKNRTAPQPSRPAGSRKSARRW